MKKKVNGFVALLLASIMMIIALPMGAFADNPEDISITFTGKIKYYGEVEGGYACPEIPLIMYKQNGMTYEPIETSRTTTDHEGNFRTTFDGPAGTYYLGCTQSDYMFHPSNMGYTKIQVSPSFYGYQPNPIENCISIGGIQNVALNESETAFTNIIDMVPIVPDTINITATAKIYNKEYTKDGCAYVDVSQYLIDDQMTYTLVNTTDGSTMEIGNKASGSIDFNDVPIKNAGQTVFYLFENEPCYKDTTTGQMPYEGVTVGDEIVQNGENWDDGLHAKCYAIVVNAMYLNNDPFTTRILATETKSYEIYFDTFVASIGGSKMGTWLPNANPSVKQGEVPVSIPLVFNNMFAFAWDGRYIWLYPGTECHIKVAKYLTDEQDVTDIAPEGQFTFNMYTKEDYLDYLNNGTQKPTPYYTFKNESRFDEYFRTEQNADGSTDVYFWINAPGIRQFVVEEVNDEQSGITYDDTMYLASVEVGFFDDFQFTQLKSAEYSKIKDNDFDNPIGKDEYGCRFTNKYSVSPTDITLTGTKTLTGKVLADNMFTFSVYEGDTVVATGKNKADGTIDFSEIEYTTAGTHHYTVKEDAGTLGGITYDDTEFAVTVTVVDNGDGTLTATAAGDTIAFGNEYKVVPTGVDIAGTAVLTGKDIEDGMFTFDVYENGKLVITSTNKADGSIDLSKIQYTTAGTHNYTIKQNIGTLAGITYDETEYTVTVTVVDKGDGTLVATTTGDNDVVFNNVYKENGDADNGDNDKPDTDTPTKPNVTEPNVTEPDKVDASTSPKTGETDNVMAYLALMAISTLFAVSLIIVKNKQK